MFFPLGLALLLNHSPVFAGTPDNAPPPLDGRECAERLILLAAKKNVADNFDNSPTSGGKCAYGVRTSLQASRVGAVTGGLGNAIDYLKTLPPHNFADSGGRDVRIASAGSVLVFNGPHSDDYLDDGEFDSPPGDWLGHVTIKGDDGRYYTDGRTREPALGWANGINTQHRRNLVAMFRPNDALAGEYAGKCARIADEERAVSLQLAAAETRTRAFESEWQRAEGVALVQEGLVSLTRGARTPAAVFQQALRLAREGIAFDEEGQLVGEIARRLRREPLLRGMLDDFFAALPPAQGAPERCKTRVLENALARALCLGASQDAGEKLGQRCGKVLSFAGCLALP